MLFPGVSLATTLLTFGQLFCTTDVTDTSGIYDIIIFLHECFQYSLEVMDVSNAELMCVYLVS